MGSGDKELGLRLITNYLKLLNEESYPPKFITFYNEGVRLISNDSPALEELKALEEKGVKLIACKTCLNHFGLIDQIAVGIAGTMVDIIQLQKKAAKVVNV